MLHAVMATEWRFHWIVRTDFGPQDGRWYWTVLFRPDGSVGNGGNGFTATGREAREACEARIPEKMRD